MKIQDAKILVVDDDPLMRKFVVNSLTRLGAQAIHEGSDGSAGLAAVAAFRPDVILSDIHMHPMDGFEFIRLLRAHAQHDLRKTPVIMMSADTKHATLQESVPLGIFGYIVKPPHSATLKDQIERALKFRV